jgi:hypothetical protein
MRQKAAFSSDQQRKKKDRTMNDTGPFDFGTALNFLKDGHRVTRTGWNGKKMWLALHRPNQLELMTLPYIFMRTAQGDLVPWLASQTDLLADDWETTAGLD